MYRHACSAVGRRGRRRLPISRPLASSRQRRLLYCPRPARRGTWPAFRVFAPTLDLPPTQRGERNSTSLMVAPDRQQVTVTSRRIVVYAAVAHVQAINNGIAEWPAALDHSAAHGTIM